MHAKSLLVYLLQKYVWEHFKEDCCGCYHYSGSLKNYCSIHATTVLSVRMLIMPIIQDPFLDSAAGLAWGKGESPALLVCLLATDSCCFLPGSLWGLY